jgi:hypothetical protein
MWLYEEDLPKLKRLYLKAIKANKYDFTYKGEVIDVNYCKYLLESNNMLDHD